MPKRNIIAIILILFFVFRADAAIIKMLNGIQYPDARIITEDRVFKESRDRIEVKVTVGSSSGRMQLKNDEIYDIICDNSMIFPKIISTKGNTIINNLSGNPVNDSYVSPLDTIITKNKSSVDISFEDIPALRILANTKIFIDIKDIDRSEVAIGEMAVPTPDQGASENINNIDEIVFNLIEGEMLGIFDTKNNNLNSGFYIDTADALIEIYSPKFYISSKNQKGNRVLTICAFDGLIKFYSKKLDKNYQLQAGEYTEIYNGDTMQKPANFNSSPLLSKMFGDTNG